VLVLDAQGRVAWRSPQAAAWLHEFHPQGLPAAWADEDVLEHRSTAPDGRMLVVRHAGAVGLGERMLLLRLQAASDAPPSRLSTASLTPRETEVLSWIAKGKTNRDVGEILGMSPRTVNKHLEHVFEKLGVETRAAAAALASRELG
jgi:DNA-binding CsgD family transcriptional regulator